MASLRLATVLLGSTQRWGSRSVIRSALFSTNSTPDELVVTSTDESSGIATLHLNRPPVNSLSLEMLQAISASIKSVESNPNIQSLVLTSSNPKVFCGGLDIKELYQPADESRVQEFWHAFQQVYLDLYGSRLACIAAIQGHAPGAGCILALCCDYRIMATSFRPSISTIGLNEVKLGIVAPPWTGTLMVDTVGTRVAEQSLSLGLLYSAQEALDISLVDEVVQAKEHLMERAKDAAAKWAAIPPDARYASKLLIRKRRLDELLATREQDTRDFCAFVMKQSTQDNLGAYVEALKNKQKK